MNRIVVVRHGNTFLPDEPPRRIGIATDLPLTSWGVVQARALATEFGRRGLRFDRCLSGSLARTTRTAQVILTAMGEGGKKIDVAPWLDEIDHGPDENMPEATVVARIGRAALRNWDRHGVAPPQWQIDADARIAAWQAIFAAPPAGSVLIVTSNGAARFALLATDWTMPASLKLRTGAYGEFVRAGDGSWSLAAWNRQPAAGD